MGGLTGGCWRVPGLPLSRQQRVRQPELVRRGHSPELAGAVLQAIETPATPAE